MPNPAAAAALRIMELDLSSCDFETGRLAVKTIIEEEFWGKVKRENEGPVDSNYVKRSLKSQ